MVLPHYAGLAFQAVFKHINMQPEDTRAYSSAVTYSNEVCKKEKSWKKKNKRKKLWMDANMNGVEHVPVNPSRVLCYPAWRD